MTIEELMAMIGGDNADTIKNGIVGLINDEKTKGVESYNKKDKETMKFKNALKGLGYDHEKHETVDSFLTEFQDELSNKDKTITDDKITTNSLNEKIDLLTKSISDRDAREEVLRVKTENATMRSKLTEALTGKVYGPNFIIDSLITNKEVSLNDDKVVFGDGDSVVDFDTGIAALFENNKGVVISQQSGGTGEPSNSSQEVKDPSEMSIEETNANLSDLKTQYGLK